MPPKLFLKNITVPEPCAADWDSMTGNDQVRFCEHCELSVHYLSRLTRNQAERLVARSNGRLCIRYEQDAQGQPAFTPVRQKLYRISRRASQIAAGAFTATLSLSSAIAQQAPQNGQSNSYNLPAAAQSNARWGLGTSIVGTITDPVGAVIPSASVTLWQGENPPWYTSADFNGQFRVDGLQAGSYQLRIEAPGFEAEEVNSVYVSGRGETRLDRSLRVAAIEVSVDVEDSGHQIVSYGGVMAFVAPEHPFIKAAQSDDLETLTSLISGMDVNLRDKRSGTTALEHAVRNANREMVQLLLSAGAKPNASDASGQTVLMMVDDDATSDLVWDLINAGAKVNLQDKSGNTPLMDAAGSDSLEAVKTLLEAGAKVDTRNEQGRTALMLAASEGHVNVVRALILAGADMTLIDDEDKDALAYALENNHKVVVRLLKAKGALETLALAEAAKEEEPE